MARVRNSTYPGVRAAYVEEMRGLVDRYGHIEGCPWPAELVKLQAGEPMVRQGWHFDLRPPYDNFLLDTDDSVTPVEPVYDDPEARSKRIVAWQRPDGSIFTETGRREDTEEPRAAFPQFVVDPYPEERR